MKKIFIIILLFNSFVSYSQIKKEYSKSLEIVTKIINQHITFLSYTEINDTLKVELIVYYNFDKETYVYLYKKDIFKLYPELLIGIALKFNIPSSSTNRRNIDNINCIATLNFVDRAYLSNGGHNI